MNAPVQLSTLRQQPQTAVATKSAEEDYSVDFFSVRGFRLAHKLAETFASSDAVPAMFRSANLKRSGTGDNRQEVWVENPAAIGNCLVAIETARAVGMSITAVMQHANIIEGKLSWSAQFVIAAINASGRFTPLRFDIKQRGPIRATYKEKGSWDNTKRGYTFTDKTVEVDDVQCIAWALPHGFVLPKNIATLQQVRDAGLPVIEGSPVSIKMAVEEGWYSKPGSKWQTEMKSLMLQYRAGAFFGRVHAPDVVMGMGRTSEEEQDMLTVDMAPNGSVNSVTLETVSRSSPTPPAQVVDPAAGTGAMFTQGPAATQQAAPMADGTRSTDQQAPAKTAAPAFDAESFASRMEACKDVETLDAMADQARDIPDADTRAVIASIYDRCREALLIRPDLRQSSAAQPVGRAEPAANATARRQPRNMPPVD